MRIPLPGWLLLGGLLVAVVACFLPFFSYTVIEGLPSLEGGMKPVFKVVVIVIVAAAIFAVWPLISGSSLPNGRLIGATVAVALLIGLWILAIVVNSKPDVYEGSADMKMSWAFGAYLFLLALIAMVAGVVMLWMQRGKAQGPAR